jgi:hypothetical protein
MSYDVTVPFTDQEIDLIYKAGLTIGELRDFYARFPEQALDTAIGGALMEKQNKEAGATIPLDSSIQDTANALEKPAEPTTDM